MGTNSAGVVWVSLVVVYLTYKLAKHFIYKREFRHPREVPLLREFFVTQEIPEEQLSQSHAFDTAFNDDYATNFRREHGDSNIL